MKEDTKAIFQANGRARARNYGNSISTKLPNSLGNCLRKQKSLFDLRDIQFECPSGISGVETGIALYTMWRGPTSWNSNHQDVISIWEEYALDSDPANLGLDTILNQMLQG